MYILETSHRKLAYLPLFRMRAETVFEEKGFLCRWVPLDKGCRSFGILEMPRKGGLGLPEVR